MEVTEALSRIRAIADYPIPGVLFQDITPLLSDSKALRSVVAALSKTSEPYDYVAGIEARGFILGSAIATLMDVGFVPIRKKGKLPHSTFSRSYGLEYGTDELEIHTDAVPRDSRVLLVDDVLATGGTLEAALNLLSDIGAHAVAVCVLMEISSLEGREKLSQNFPALPIHSLISH
ncbi:unannotated protein [freshwater metagenome]|uniref:adenine phosphoribosyltransferase n=1 Tax=freshwater metagenome TaxID=449393 RepID=A0A6J6AT97_9ZZZZ|nr:adenine phosphoribosyltransferase [Actinomycetota bacterium]